MMLLAWLGISVCVAFLVLEYKHKPKKKPALKRKIRYEKRRAKIHRIK